MPMVPWAPWTSRCQDGDVGPVGRLLHAADRPLFLDGARAGCLPGAEIVAGAEDHLEAGHRVGDVPLILGHDHRLPLEQAADHALGGPRQRGAC